MVQWYNGTLVQYTAQQGETLMSRCHDVTVSPSDCNSRMASPILTFQTKSKQNAETLCPMERFSYLCNEFDTDMMTLTIKATDMIILTKNTTKMMLRWLAGILGLMQPLLQAGVSLLHGLVVDGVGQRQFIEFGVLVTDRAAINQSSAFEVSASLLVQFRPVTAFAPWRQSMCQPSVRKFLQG